MIHVIESTFPDFTDRKLIEELARTSSVRNVKEGDILIDYGDVIKAVPLVLKGTIKVSRQAGEDKEIFLYYLSGGDTCAASFSCCMVRKRSEIFAVAEEDSTLLMVPLEKADQWMSIFPTWRNFIFNMYEMRLFSMIDTIDRLAFSNLDEQLIEYLQMKSEVTKSNAIETTHQHIAYDLNVSREAVSRLLKKLEKKGEVKLERNRIILAN